MPVDIETVGDQLRAKIVSKFQIAGTMAGLVFATLGIQLSLLYQDNISRFLPESIGLMFTSASLFCVSLYRLDGLTMPKMFWERSWDSAPYGDDSWSLTPQNLMALKTRMLFIWMRPAVVAI